MLGANEQRSEVARLLAQIGAEYQAGHRALSGGADVASQHGDLITVRTNTMGQLHIQLQGIVGEHEAVAMIADQLNQME